MNRGTGIRRREGRGHDDSLGLARGVRGSGSTSLEVRMRYSFIHTYKPVMDDASYRSFDTMEDYRRWCEDNLPSWLGYGRV